MGGHDKCSVGGCSNDKRGTITTRGHVTSLIFHKFPKNEMEASKWTAQVAKGRANFIPGPGARVCSNHFEDGRPTSRKPFPTLYLCPSDQARNSPRIRHPVQRLAAQTAQDSARIEGADHHVCEEAQQPVEVKICTASEQITRDSDRAVAGVDPQELNADQTSGAKMLKAGHAGLLTIDDNATVEDDTTFKISYKPPSHPNVKQRGAKSEMLERMLYEQVSKQVEEEFSAPPEQEEYKSVTHMDYNKDDFVPSKVEPTAHHDFVSEQPVTFWTEHKDKMHGISQIKPTFDSPFRKNAAFSTPIDEYTDQPMPYEHDLVPNM